MTWAYVAVGAGTVISGYLGSQSANKAGKAAKEGSQQAIDESRRQFDLVRSDTAGARFIGQGATNTLARLYGYGPTPQSGAGATAGATPYSPTMPADNGFFNTGAGKVLNPWSVTSKLGSAGKILDPAGGLLGNLFGNTHGDEKRNLQAFAAESGVMQLPNGMLMLPDGSTFSEAQLKDVAGTWYGAVHAPDGNQEDWQNRYTTLLGGLQKTPVGQSQTAAAAPATGTGQPDMSAFFESPDYQFRLGEGEKAINRLASARGGFQSGGAGKELVRYNSGLASGEYGAFIDRLMQQAGLGSTGIGASAAAGANTASTVANAATNAANARGSAYLTAGNAINNSVQGGIQNLLLAKYLGG